MTRRPTDVLAGLLASFLLVAAVASCGSPADHSAEVDTLFAEARRLDALGRHDDAVATYGRLLELEPDSFDGHYWIARALDLAGRYEEARQHFARAIDLADESNTDQTLRMMGIAWTFTGNTDEAHRYFTRVIDRRLETGNPAGAAEVCNELGRVYLEAGDADRAETWYRTGYETAARETGRSEAQADLADLRWAHAQARIAARRGQAAEARQHTATVRALIDKDTNTDQEVQYAYLEGYVAFHLGDPEAAIAALERADQSDPFILLLLAQASERMGNDDLARAYFIRVLESTSHAVNNAFARPVARAWLDRNR